jgi:hypothetical protein
VACVVQVCTPLPEHCFCPAVQGPMQVPPEQLCPQATAVPHCPAELQVCTPLLMHCVLPGTQTPVQVPFEHV